MQENSIQWQPHMLFHSEVERLLSTSEQVYTPSIVRSLAGDQPLDVIHQVLSVDNYKEKFFKLLQYEQVTHAEILHER